jgi:hypothetical protein
LPKQNYYAKSLTELEKFKYFESHEKLTTKEHLQITLKRGKPMFFCGKHGIYLESCRGCRIRNCQWLISETTAKVYV